MGGWVSTDRPEKTCVASLSQLRCREDEMDGYPHPDVFRKYEEQRTYAQATSTSVDSTGLREDPRFCENGEGACPPGGILRKSGKYRTLWPPAL